MSYSVNYTEKEFKGVKSFETNTKVQAEAWVEKNKAKLYWSQIIKLDAKSEKTKPSGDVDLSKYKKIQGVLQSYFETGMECLGLTLYDTTVNGPPNPAFDESKKESGSNFRFYRLHEATYFIEHGDILQVNDGPKWTLQKDREFAADDGYRLSFYPRGFSRKELLELFSPEDKKATLWRKNKT
jgi:hypothetical protein